MNEVFELFAKLKLDQSEFNSGLKNAKSTAVTAGEKVGSAFSKGLKTAAKVGSLALTVATGAVTAFAKKSIDAGKSFDTMMGQVGSTMGKGVDDMKQEIGEVDTAYGKFSGTLRDFALFMGKNTKFSATEAAQALNYMALAGYDAQKSMDMLPTVLNLAAAGAMDLGRASDMITDTQSALGLSAEETARMVNEFAKAASSGNTTVEMMGDAFLTVGALAKEVNGGFVTLSDGTEAAVDGVQQLEIAFTAMANAGIKGSEAGTHMRNMILKLSNPTKEGTKDLEEMGISIYDNEGKMRALNDIFGDLSETFKTMSQQSKLSIIGDLFNARDTASATALMAAIEGTVTYGGEVYALSDAYAKWGDQIYDTSKGFKYQAAAWDSLGEAILGAGEDGVLFKGKVYSMDDALKEFGNDIYDTAKGFKILGAAEAMAMRQQDNLTGDMTKMNSALEYARIKLSDKLTPSLRTFTQFATESIGDIADAFGGEGGISAAMDVFGEKLEQALTMIFDKADVLIEVGGKLVAALGKGLLNNLPKLLEAGKKMLLKFAEKISENPEAISNGILALVNNIIAVFHDPAALKALARAAVTIITELGKALIGAIPQLIEVAKEIVGAFIDAIAEKIPGLKPALDAVVVVFNNIADAISGVITWIGDFLSWLTSGSKSAEIFSSVLGGIALAIGTIVVAMKLYKTWATIVKVATEAWAVVQGVLNGAMLANPIGLVIAGIVALIAVITLLSQHWEEVVDFFEEGFEAIVTLAQYAWEGIQSAFSAVGQWFADVFTGAKNAVVGAFHSIVEWFQGIWESIKSIFAGIGEWFGNLFTGAVEAIKTAFDAVVGVVKAPLNWIIKAINFFIDGLNKIQVPDWVPLVGGMGINIPRIPELAQGGVLKKGQKGYLEGNGAEAVVPLDQNEKWIHAVAEDMRNALLTENVNNNSGEYTVNHTGTIRIEGVNNQGEFVAASEYVIEEIITNIMKREARLA